MNNKITFSKLNLEYKENIKTVKFSEDITLNIKQYLPQKEKAELLDFIIMKSLDNMSGCFSPIRLETYTSLAIAKWYAGINFTEKQIENAPKTYDILETNNMFEFIINNIPKVEYDFIEEMIQRTCEDISRFNCSFRGIVQSLSEETKGLDNQLKDIFSKLKDTDNKDNLNFLKEIMTEAGTSDGVKQSEVIPLKNV